MDYIPMLIPCGLGSIACPDCRSVSANTGALEICDLTVLLDEVERFPPVCGVGVQLCRYVGNRIHHRPRCFIAENPGKGGIPVN